MNSLSWFILLFNAISTIKWFLMVSSLLLLIALPISWIILANRTNGSGGYTYTLDSQRLAKKIAIRITIAFAIVFTIAAIIPPKKIMLLIAASEIGERVVSSDRAQRIINPSLELLEEWIQSEIKRLGKSK